MEALNLEKYSSTKAVKIPGHGEATLRVFSVGDFIEGKDEQLQSKLQGNDGRTATAAMVDFIVEYSDIPRDVLLKQGVGMLQVIISIIQSGEVPDVNGTTGGNEKNV